MTLPDSREAKTATIALNGSLSAAVDLTGLVLVGLQMPAAWTAASITLQASADGTTYGDFKDYAGNEYTLTVTVSDYLHLDFVELMGVRYIKVRSGTSASAVNQGASRAITLVTMPI